MTITMSRLAAPLSVGSRHGPWDGPPSPFSRFRGGGFDAGGLSTRTARCRVAIQRARQPALAGAGGWSADGCRSWDRWRYTSRGLSRPRRRFSSEGTWEAGEVGPKKKKDPPTHTQAHKWHTHTQCTHKHTTRARTHTHTLTQHTQRNAHTHTPDLAFFLSFSHFYQFQLHGWRWGPERLALCVRDGGQGVGDQRAHLVEGPAQGAAATQTPNELEPGCWDAWTHQAPGAEHLGGEGTTAGSGPPPACTSSMEAGSPAAARMATGRATRAECLSGTV